MCKALGDQWLYEPYRLPYIIKKKYIPDFVHEEAGVLVECKGFFRVGDTQKYTSIRDGMPEWKLVFVFTNPKKKLRKGSKMTLGEWCDKEGFPYFTEAQAEELKEYVKCRQPLKN
jgi:hypothetical protein